MIRDCAKPIRSTLLVAVLIAAVMLGLASGGALLFAALGFYNVAAVRQHTALVYHLLEMTNRASVVNHARGIRAPDLSDPARAARGLALYRQHCTRCHGAPGIAPADFAKSMIPAPPPLVEVAREWTPAEMYWAIRTGIKMTGMPAWEYRLPDGALWDIVAFLRVLPRLSPAEYCARVTGRACTPAVAASRASAPETGETGDPARGKIAPAVRLRPLDDMALRLYIAGLLINTPENMIAWIRHPQAVKPLTAMPDLGVLEKDARDMTAYLYSHR